MSDFFWLRLVTLPPSVIKPSLFCLLWPFFTLSHTQYTSADVFVQICGLVDLKAQFARQGQKILVAGI